MTKFPLSGALGAVLCVTLAACSTTGNPDKMNQLSQKTVQYQCSAQGQRTVNLEVQYTFQGNDPVTAQVIYDNQAIALTRATNSKTDMVGDTFTGNGYTWTTGKFTLESAGQVNGNMLIRQETSAGTTGAPTNTILARNCKAGG
ncbi:MAG TPA: hypothetical protein VFR20_02740 [Burkholderiaceae bacterium]|nr:hypothetical protein [Burkholderiaceae bacterium]